MATHLLAGFSLILGESGRTQFPINELARPVSTESLFSIVAFQLNLMNDESLIPCNRRQNTQLCRNKVLIADTAFPYHLL